MIFTKKVPQRVIAGIPFQVIPSNQDGDEDPAGIRLRHYFIGGFTPDKRPIEHLQGFVGRVVHENRDPGDPCDGTNCPTGRAHSNFFETKEGWQKDRAAFGFGPWTPADWHDPRFWTTRKRRDKVDRSIVGRPGAGGQVIRATGDMEVEEPASLLHSVYRGRVAFGADENGEERAPVVELYDNHVKRTEPYYVVGLEIQFSDPVGRKILELLALNPQTFFVIEKVLKGDQVRYEVRAVPDPVEVARIFASLPGMPTSDVSAAEANAIMQPTSVPPMDGPMPEPLQATLTPEQSATIDELFGRS